MTDDRALARLAADPVYRARVLARYRGRHTLDDAVWWATHPEVASPAGTASPAAALAALRRAVYSVAGRDDDGSAAALARLEGELDADRLYLDEALLDVDEPEPDARHEVQPADPDPLDRLDPLDPLEWIGEERDEGQAPQPRRARLAAIIVGALIVAAVATASIIGSLGSLGLMAPGDEPSATAVDGPVEQSPAGDALAVFRTTRTVGDFPDIPISDGLDSETLHAFPGVTTGDEVPGILTRPYNTVYAAKDIDGRICLLAMAEDGAYAASCVTEEQFRLGGVRLEFATMERPEFLDARSTSPAGMRRAELITTWSDDGFTLSTMGLPSATPRAALD